jgi:hypothetical protein
MRELLADYEKQRKLANGVLVLQQDVQEKSDAWMRARGLGTRQTSTEFADDFFKKASGMDVDKALERLAADIDRREDELDKSLTNLSELAAGTVKTGISALGHSPEAIVEGIGLGDKIRKAFANPYARKGDELAAVSTRARYELVENGERLVAHALMGLNSAAFKLSLRMSAWDLPGGRCDFIDRYKNDHSTAMLDLNEVASDVKQIQVLAKSAQRRAERIRAETGNFGVRFAVAVEMGLLLQDSVDSHQKGFLRLHSDGLRDSPMDKLTRGYEKLTDLLEASDLHLRAVNKLRSLFAANRSVSFALTRPGTLLATIRDACMDRGHKAPSTGDRNVSTARALDELSIIRLIIQGEALKSPDMREGCKTALKTIDETASYLATLKKNDIDSVRISAGPSDMNFFSRLRDEVRWQYEPIKKVIDERKAEDLIARQQSFSEHSRNQLAERIASQMTDRIRATLPGPETETPQNPGQDVSHRPPRRS